MDKTGVVVNVEKNHVIILTRDGEFAKVKLKGKDDIPEKGQEYTSKEVKEIKFKFSKEKIIIFLIVIISIIGILFYGYLRPTGSVSIDGEVSLVLKFNYFNKVTKIQSFDEESEAFINSINVKNKDITTVILKTYNKMKEENMVMDKNNSHNTTTYFLINGKKDIELKEFINILQEDNKKVIVTKDGISIFRY